MNDIMLYVVVFIYVILLGVAFTVAVVSLAEQNGWKDGSYH